MGAEAELSDLEGGDPAFRVGTSAQNGGVLEGTIDLVAAFGAVPAVVYVAAAPWGSGDAGPMYGVAQAPAGNGDANLDPDEFVKVRLPDLTVVP